jgi:hypothetical protein
MNWRLGALVLLIAALVLRRLLRMNASAEDSPAFEQLRPECQALYAPIGLELETQVAILSVLLNDAIDERNAGRLDIAWRLVRLSVSEWQRLAGFVTALLDVLRRNTPRLHATVSYRSRAARHFRSQAMIDHWRMPELLTQLPFPSKTRFHIQIDTLRSAAAKLSTEFYRTTRSGEGIEDRSTEVWERLDLYLHDFDLLNKEALLALRACLMSLPPSALKGFSAELEPLLRRGVRTASVPAGH